MPVKLVLEESTRPNRKFVEKLSSFRLSLGVGPIYTRPGRATQKPSPGRPNLSPLSLSKGKLKRYARAQPVPQAASQRIRATRSRSLKRRGNFHRPGFETLQLSLADFQLQRGALAFGWAILNTKRTTILVKINLHFRKDQHSHLDQADADEMSGKTK